MLEYDLLSSEDLPSSDDTPVDNEIQNLIPNLLLLILAFAWETRQDWFFGADMVVYNKEGQKSGVGIVPDGFLSIGVERRKRQPHGRLSYVLSEENNIPPIFVLEIVSKSPGKEYEEKLRDYAEMGVLYYCIYNPEYWRRDRHNPFEVYRLENKKYVLQVGEPVWMPEIELGIGRGIGSYTGWEREWLYWYDRSSNRYPVPEDLIERLSELASEQRQRAERAESLLEQERERAEQERERADRAVERAQQERERADRERQQVQQERQRAEQLAEMLRNLGIDPDRTANE